MLLHRKRVFTSPRSVEKRRKQYAVRVGAALVIFLVLSTVLSFFSWRPEINIGRITVLGNTTVPEEDVRGYLEDRIEGGYLGIFSRANVFLFQPRIVEKELQ